MSNNRVPLREGKLVNSIILFEKRYGYIFSMIIAVPIILIIINVTVGNRAFSSNYKQAILSIEYISDTVKWFITIQAGILGFIGNLILNNKKKKEALINQFFRPICFWCMSIFCGAWVLTGLPSILLRLADPEFCNNFDVLLMPIYSWFSTVGLSFLNLSFFYSLIHWYWAFGILSFVYTLVRKKT